MSAKTKQRHQSRPAARGKSRRTQVAVNSDPRAAEAARLQSGGEYDRASTLWHAILKEHPDDVVALQHLGILQLQQPDGDMELAQRLLGRAAELLPQSAPAAMHHGLALQRAGRHPEAEAQLRGALALKPDYAEAYNNLGVSLVSQGRIEQAAEAFRSALAHAPDYTAAQSNLDGIGAYSDDAWELKQKAQRLYRLERYAEAAEVYRQLPAKSQETSQIRLALADCLRQAVQPEAAIAELEAIQEVEPNRPDVRWKLAILLYERARYRDVVTQLDAIDPADDVYHRRDHLRANALRYLRDYHAAEKAYRSAMERAPEDGMVRNDYGLMLSAMNRTTEASVELLHAVRLDPDNWQPYNNLGNVLKDQGRVLDSLELYENALSRCGRHPMLHSNLVFTLNYLAGLSRDAVFEGHKKFQECLDHITPQQTHPNDPDPERRLRVGYVSADFRSHSVAHFFEPLLRCHDRARVEVFLYANVTNPDAVTERMRGQADHMRDVREWPPKAVADQIRHDGIDILIDLNGHTGNNLLEVFHYKPAPVQVSWLGYPNTTGLDTVDYRIVDAITEPAGDAERTSTERIVRLAGGFHCFDPGDNGDLAVSPPPVHANGFVRFGSFNYLAKISEDVVRTWARILTRVPNSRLLMKARGLGDTLSTEAYLALFEKYGVARERIEVVSYQPSQREHRQLYGAVDIALDTFPYNGTTTTCEALWMGVPVVAVLGETHAARASASLMTHIGAPELVAEDLDEYVELAVTLADNRSELDRYRANLRPMLETSPIGDANGFTRKFEAALDEMWRAWCADGAREPVVEKPEWTLEIEGDLKVRVPASLDLMTPYILLEQERWFETEIDFVSRLIQPGWHVVDIGANYGMYTLTMAQAVGPEGRVFAFEPSASTADCLAQSCDLNGFSHVTITRCALADQPGQGVLSAESNTELGQLTDAAEGGGHTVNIEMLDNFADTFAQATIAFVKMDAEGAEERILAGAEDFLARHAPIFMFEIKHGRSVNRSLIGAFQARGYDIYTHVPGLNALVRHTDDANLDSYQLNCFAMPPSRTADLIARDLIVDAAMDVPDASADGWRNAADLVPADSALRQRWNNLSSETTGDGWAAHREALNLMMVARDTGKSTSHRYAALKTATETLRDLVNTDGNVPRLCTLTHGLLELGHRNAAVQVLRRLTEVLQHAPDWPLPEPFLPLTATMERPKTGLTPGSWLYLCALQTLQRAATYSGYFAPQAQLSIGQSAVELAGHSTEAKRRFALASLRTGGRFPESCRGLSKQGRNAAIWAELAGPSAQGGSDAVANVPNTAGPAAKPTLPAMLRAETDIVIADIGAMLLGDQAPEYGGLLDAGAARIVGFEPDAQEHTRLEEKYPAPHRFHRAFVGNGGPATYYETATTMTGSLYEPNAALIGNYEGLSAQMRLAACHPVETTTLDAVIGDTDIDMIKIDVQGGELDVFKGGPCALANAVVVQTEVEFVELYKHQPLFGDVDRFLNDAGFQFLAFRGLAGRPPVAPGGILAPKRLPATQALWADAVYVPKIGRFPELNSQKLIKLARIAHTLYGANDIAWRALAEVDGRDGSRRARDLADHLKVS